MAPPTRCHLQQIANRNNFTKDTETSDTQILRTHTHAHTHLHPPAGNRVEWNEREWNGMAEQSVSI